MQLNDPRIVVWKSRRELELFGGRCVRVFRAVLGRVPAGGKAVAGDGRTPEGDFFVCARNPKSKYHLSLCLSYPEARDAERGLAAGIVSPEERDEIVAAISAGRMPPQNTALGGEIYIHGGGTEGDWTQGCVALADDEMSELYALVPLGTPVRIEP